MNALQMCHAYLIGSTIHTPKSNRTPTKEEVIKAILDELNNAHHQADSGTPERRPNDGRGDH